MKHNKKLIEKIAMEVESDFELGGLSSGIYLDFATEVSIRYAETLLKNNKKLVK